MRPFWADFGLPFGAVGEKLPVLNLCKHKTPQRKSCSGSGRGWKQTGNASSSAPSRWWWLFSSGITSRPEGADGNCRRPGLHRVANQPAGDFDGQAGGGWIFANCRQICGHTGGTARAVAGGGKAVRRRPLCGCAGAVSKISDSRRRQLAGGAGAAGRRGKPGGAGQTGRRRWQHIARWRRATRIRRKRSPAKFSLGRVLELQGKLSEAVSYYQEVTSSRHWRVRWLRKPPERIAQIQTKLAAAKPAAKS